MAGWLRNHRSRGNSAHQCGARKRCRLGVIVMVVCLASQAAADDHRAAQRGFRLLTTKAYVPADFDQETFDAVWRVWPEPLRTRAERASVEERRRLAFQRYGLTRLSAEEASPLQYVVDSEGRWSMNCFACHGGRVNGAAYPGSPNTDFALATLTEEICQTKFRLGKPLGHMEIGALFMPLGQSIGTTNAVNFGIALMASRDAELNVVSRGQKPVLSHHDLDAPPWWHLRRKTRMYADGSVPKGHRALMQFALVRENGPERFREWERDFRDILAYLESVEPPKYPFEIDHHLAETGRRAFERSCSRCHGRYRGGSSTWPERIVAIDEVRTDPVRLQAFTAADRAHYAQSWFANYGAQQNWLDPGGYVAPPLDGVWASAPYFHNGSVPTLWHVLHPDQRPSVWRRLRDEYDRERVGFTVDELDVVPSNVRILHERRHYFDTALPGKSNAGHTFPEDLSPAERAAVLEYLKTL